MLRCFTRSLLISSLALVAGCGDPAPVPPLGGVAITIGPDPMGASCGIISAPFNFPLGTDAYRALTSDEEKVEPDFLVADGEGKADVSCSMEGDSTFTFTGSITIPGTLTFSISNGQISPTGGSAKINDFHNSGSGSVLLSGDCEITPVFLNDESVKAKFDCPMFSITPRADPSDFGSLAQRATRNRGWSRWSSLRGRSRGYTASCPQLRFAQRGLGGRGSTNLTRVPITRLKSAARSASMGPMKAHSLRCFQAS